jgi:hypothetical protein
VSARRAAWWLFAVFALTVPFPAFGPLGEFAPAVRHLVIFTATAAVAATEGVAGPVPGLLALFLVESVVTLAASGLAAWLAARLLAGRSPAVRRAVVIAVGVALLALSLAFPIYRTPFGRAPTGNLLGLFS